jgi:hypothetical protein
MNKITLEYLINCEIFSMKNYTKTKDEAINKKEILMSRKIIENNWNIGSLLPFYKNVDFTFKDKSPKEYNIDFLYDNKYIENIMYTDFKNCLFNEYDLVFIKINRIR